MDAKLPREADRRNASAPDDRRDDALAGESTIRDVAPDSPATQGAAVQEMISEGLAESGRGIVWRIRGVSMAPLLEDGDLVFAAGIKSPIETGDIALFSSRHGELVCHRVLLPPGEGPSSAAAVAELAGDNNQRLDLVAPESFVARVYAAQRKGRRLRLDRGLLQATAPLIGRWHRRTRILLHPGTSPSSFPDPEARRGGARRRLGWLLELARRIFLRLLANTWFFARSINPGKNADGSDFDESAGAPGESASG